MFIEYKQGYCERAFEGVGWYFIYLSHSF